MLEKNITNLVQDADSMQRVFLAFKDNSSLVLTKVLSPFVNTGFWSVLEDDRWTHMQEEECSANNASGRLNACAVGYSGRR